MILRVNRNTVELDNLLNEPQVVACFLSYLKSQQTYERNYRSNIL